MTSDRTEPDVENSIWIGRPPQDIWDYIVDVSNDAEWRGAVAEAQWSSDPPHGVGSTGLHIIESIGDYPWKATAFEEPRILAWKVTGGRISGGHGAYRIESDGDGSRFTIEARFPRSVIMKLLMPILKRRINRQDTIDLEKIKTILEA